MNYDQNLVFCGGMARQTVRLTFGMWEYRAEKETIVAGNCLGLEVIAAAVESVYERLPENGHGAKELVMKNDEGTSLQCYDEEEEGEDWLKNMLVKAEIVSIEEEKK
ncbi:MAG: DUF5406 domain-containing protein [Treponemataceae bacterium]|nr:DUF5406 domain-containing protein [Treponemataceae bacterium]